MENIETNAADDLTSKLGGAIKEVDLSSNPQQIPKEESEVERDFRSKFSIFGPCALIYGLIYTFCMYENAHGLASTILIYATFASAYFVFKNLGYKIGKSQIVYAVIGAVLGFNLMFTLDEYLLFVDYVALILVFVSGVFSVVCDNSDWNFTDHVIATISQIIGSLANVFDIFSDWGKYGKERKGKTGISKYIFTGILLAIPLLIVIIMLLCSADIVFREYVSVIFDDVDLVIIIRILFVITGATIGFYSWIAHFLNKRVYITHVDKRHGEPVILITIGSLLGVVYLLFCGIQIVYLFARLGELPFDYTYARYAREGFFQLLAVCLINLLLVLIGISKFRDNKVLRAVLTVITGCTYIMIASSTYRMCLYISEYDLSSTRVWVLWTLLWLTFILTGALINVYKSTFSLFKYSMIVTAILYMFIAYARPSYIVASYNLSEMAASKAVDFKYIGSELNEDATAVVQKYYMTADEQTKKTLVVFFPCQTEVEENKYSMRSFNISGYKYYSSGITRGLRD